MMTSYWWRGVSAATQEVHDACFARYAERYPDLAAYRFCVAHDLLHAEVTTDEDAANGIWTIAEAHAGTAYYPPLSWEQTDDLARVMLAAIRWHKATN